MIKAIETHYNGYRFRSRTEARWAIFFERAGIPFDYEPEGVVLDGKPYLPDFWLSSAKVWFEVKGAEPTPMERKLCERLAVESGHRCLLAVGPPNANNSIYLFSGVEGDWLGDGQTKFRFCGFNGAFALEEVDGGNYITIAQECGGVTSAYEAANSARFEHGESGAHVKGKTYGDLQRESRHLWRRNT